MARCEFVGDPVNRDVLLPENPWDEIDSRLWVGGSIEKPDDGFYAVLTLDRQVAESIPPPAGVRDCRFAFDDGPMPNPQLVWAWAREVNRMRLRGDVLVRCAAGLNRSGLLAAATLIDDGMDVYAAICRVRARRGEDALCNPNFADWLAAQDGCR